MIPQSLCMLAGGREETMVCIKPKQNLWIHCSVHFLGFFRWLQCETNLNKLCSHKQKVCSHFQVCYGSDFLFCFTMVSIHWYFLLPLCEDSYVITPAILQSTPHMVTMFVLVFSFRLKYITIINYWQSLVCSIEKMTTYTWRRRLKVVCRAIHARFFPPQSNSLFYLYNSVPLLLWGDDRSLSKKL